MKIIPKKLSKGDEIRVLSPSQSMGIISPSVRSIALKRLDQMGLKVSFSKHCEERDIFDSSSVESRVEDLHEAFRDPKIKAILTTIGGYNSIQLLKNLDYELIKKNPKILCGYSDITALQNAIFAKTGLVTYSGPHFSTFGCLHGIEYVIDYFQKCLFEEKELTIKPSAAWSDDAWYIDQENRKYIPNTGFAMVHPGKASGTIIGGNISTLNALLGTEYMPSLKDAILFLEGTSLITANILGRQLHSLILQKDFQYVKGIVLGRFQTGSNISPELLNKIIEPKEELQGIPIIANADFGHTLPMFTFPVGGEARLESSPSNIKLVF